MEVDKDMWDMETKTKTKLKLKKQVLFKGIAFVLILVSILIFLLFLKLDLIPFKYLILLFLALGMMDGLLYFLMSRKNYRLRICGTLLSIILILGFSLLLSYQNATIHFLKNITALNIQTEKYQVIVKKTSSYKTIDDLKSISYVNDRKGILKAMKEIENKKMKEKTLTEASHVIDALLDNSVDAILMEEEEAKLYLEMSTDFKENSKVLTTISVEVQNEVVTKDVKITKEPFSVFFTGIDTYGEMSKVSRSDVNMIITINPLTHKVLLVSIPRDYYVQIAGTTGLPDKLTHAGLKGVETSMKTIENLLKTEIPYYIKVNFSSVIDIVDAIGGVDVDNPFEFTADYQDQDGSFVYYKFYQGNIHLDGKKALAYARERYDLREGDVARSRHQQQIMEGLSKKLTSSTILTKYTSILKSMEGNFTTNLSLSSITGFIEKQLNENPSWEIESMVLSGSDSFELTAAFPEEYSAVMLPDQDSVKNAIQKMNEIKCEN